MPHRPATPSTTTSVHATSRVLRRVAAVALTAVVLVGTAAGVASAKELPGGGTTTCNPVTSLGYKGDATTSDTGVGTITINYAVKPCTKGQAVVVDVKLYESANPAAIAYQNPKAPLSGKFTAAGVRTNYSYTAKVTVYDAATGAVTGSTSIFAAAIRNTGV